MMGLEPPRRKANINRCRWRQSVATPSSPIFCTTSSRTLYRLWRLFLLKNPSLTHDVVPPFRNRSRSSRLFGCKRPHNGFVSLPPCFGFYFSITYTFNNYQVSFSIINSLYIVASYISLAAIFLSPRTNYNIVVGATCGRLPIHSKLKTGEHSSPLRYNIKI